MICSNRRFRVRCTDFIWCLASISMEQVLFRVHVKLLTSTNRVVTYKSRRVLEFFTLALAAASILATFLLHVTYVSNSSQLNLNCLMTEFDSFSNGTHGNHADGFNIQKQFDLVVLTIEKHRKNHADNVGKPTSHNTYYFSLDRGLIILGQENRDSHNFTKVDINLTTEEDCFGPPVAAWLLHNWVGYDTVVLNWAISTFDGKGFLFNSNKKELYNLNYATDFQSKKGVSLLDKGRIMRNNSLRLMRKMPFFDFFSQRKSIFSPMLQKLHYIYEEFIETAVEFMMKSASKTCASGDASEQQCTDKQQDVVPVMVDRVVQFVAFRTGVLFTTTFLFFVSCSLISFTLRETQHRMLRFTYLLQYYVAHHIPIHALVSTHLIEIGVFVPIMIGTYFFLFEFFSDQLLAFLVLLMVWMGEVFSILSLRGKLSIRFFPRVFMCYFYLFHIYFFTFPFGFAYTALLSTTLLLLHAMIYFWNASEVPTYESGLITTTQPRLHYSASTAMLERLNSTGGAVRQSRSPSTGGATAAETIRPSPPRRVRVNSQGSASASPMRHITSSVSQTSIPSEGETSSASATVNRPSGRPPMAKRKSYTKESYYMMRDSVDDSDAPTLLHVGMSVDDGSLSPVPGLTRVRSFSHGTEPVLGNPQQQKIRDVNNTAFPNIFEGLEARRMRLRHKNYLDEGSDVRYDPEAMHKAKDSMRKRVPAQLQADESGTVKPFGRSNSKRRKSKKLSQIAPIFPALFPTKSMQQQYMLSLKEQNNDDYFLDGSPSADQDDTVEYLDYEEEQSGKGMRSLSDSEMESSKGGLKKSMSKMYLGDSNFTIFGNFEEER